MHVVENDSDRVPRSALNVAGDCAFNRTAEQPKAPTLVSNPPRYVLKLICWLQEPGQRLWRCVVQVGRELRKHGMGVLRRSCLQHTPPPAPAPTSVDDLHDCQDEHDYVHTL